MASPSWTQVIDNMFTTTWAYRQPGATIQAFEKTPFAFWLKEKGRVKEVSGYRRLEISLDYGENETAKWIQKGDTVSLTEGDLLTMAYEDWKYLAVSILRYGVEDQKNRGKARIKDYVEHKINAAERAIWNQLERVAFADGTGSQEPNGLQNLISTTPTTGTVHGLSRATYTWWRNLQKTASGAASIWLVADMRNLMNTLTKYAESEVKDIFLMTTQTIYEAYEDEGYEKTQVVNQKLYDAGFDTLNFKGRPLMWAPSCPSGNMYFINPNYIQLMIDPDYFMQMTEWKPIPDQVNDRVAQIVSACNLVTSRPIAEGVLSGITV